MFKKLKNIILKTDSFLYKKFGSDKSTKVLENIKEARTIFTLLNEIGKEDRVRFVGGCVRKSISGENIDDIDLATILEPGEVKKGLNKKDIKVIETGISHGTVTAILNNKKFEITTLRKDVSTDGRHAKVEFTSNWEEDASRRDFTINAIYADIQGRIFDPLNGISDLQNGIIRKNLNIKDLEDNHFFNNKENIRRFIKASPIQKNDDLKNLFDNVKDIKCFPAYITDKIRKPNPRNIFFLGDAFCTPLPTFAQGASQSIESAYVLLNNLDENNFDNYFANRVKRIKMINSRSKLNYYIFHLSNPIFALIRNIILKFAVGNKSFLNKYLGQIYSRN